MVKKIVKKSSVISILGVALIISSVALLALNKLAVANSDVEIKRIVSAIEEVLPSRKSAIQGQYTNVSMPVLEIDDIDYCALLEVSKQGVILPVANNWSDSETFSARYYGSSYDGNMIVGGQYLDFVTKLDVDDQLTIVDMYGGVFDYAVSRIDRTKDVFIEKLLKDDYQLTVFFYVANEGNYVIVRCKS